MVVFDVTNQITYKPYYMALLRVFSEVRKSGGRSPQVAFLCPFGDPAKVVAELYKDLYAPGLFADLWFRWEGKPLILADAEMLGDPVGNSQKNTPAELAAGHTLGQSFTVGQPVESVAGCFPTWATHGSAMTLTLFANNPAGKRILSKRFEDVSDNAWVSLRFDPPLPPGTYYLEMSRPLGKVGWWSHTADVWPGGQALADGKPVAGDRTLRIFLTDSPSAAIRRFFTFRAAARLLPRPDEARYVELGRSLPAARLQEFAGEKEQMSVTVAQNAVDGRVGSMSEPGARGRSFHNGAVDRRRDAILYGHNCSRTVGARPEGGPEVHFHHRLERMVCRPIRRVRRDQAAGDVR